MTVLLHSDDLASEVICNEKLNQCNRRITLIGWIPFLLRSERELSRGGQERSIQIDEPTHRDVFIFSCRTTLKTSSVTNGKEVIGKTNALHCFCSTSLQLDATMITGILLLEWIRGYMYDSRSFIFDYLSLIKLKSVPSPSSLCKGRGMILSGFVPLLTSDPCQCNRLRHTCKYQIWPNILA